MPHQSRLLLALQISLTTFQFFIAYGFVPIINNDPHILRTGCNNEVRARRQGGDPLVTLLHAVPRYGPPISPDGNDQNDLPPGPPTGVGGTRTSKEEFQALVDEVMKVPQPELVPRLLANNIELIIGLQGEDGAQIISSTLEDAKRSDDEADMEESDGLYAQTLQTIDIILSFAEDFVGQAQKMDSSNKKLLGKIIKAIVKPENDMSIDGGEGRDTGVEDVASRREEELDRVMREEKKNFSTGFLRHIEGECDRITSARKVTPESAKLLELLRMIQTRVLEELGQDLGEAALVLGQLMGYEKEEELLGVLDAGLTIRGNEFALEMASLTEEALDGFSRIPGGPDPDLVQKVEFIDRRLKEYLSPTTEFQ